MLKAIRKHKGIRQADLASRLDISQSHLSKLENNSIYKINVNIAMIEKLAVELNICPVAVFLYFLNVQLFCLFNNKRTE
ncbi:helix-turn-helix domain-containing protein [Clostridium peptidivorans]|uniref:helix-turn-helix domain-containing protein n=1 Tax=Clostridium peptidivorans TaxID=100174 RepID=UPI000BE2AF31|nr:helix-turn-helix transcriptional regulator [Clostridium peptidivorans]